VSWRNVLFRGLDVIGLALLLAVALVAFPVMALAHFQAWLMRVTKTEFHGRGYWKKWDAYDRR
jgi:hypothetical protein